MNLTQHVSDLEDERAKLLAENASLKTNLAIAQSDIRRMETDLHSLRSERDHYFSRASGIHALLTQLCAGVTEGLKNIHIKEISPEMKVSAIEMEHNS